MNDLRFAHELADTRVKGGELPLSLRESRFRRGKGVDRRETDEGLTCPSDHLDKELETFY